MLRRRTNWNIWTSLYPKHKKTSLCPTIYGHFRDRFLVWSLYQTIFVEMFPYVQVETIKFYHICYHCHRNER